MSENLGSVFSFSEDLSTAEQPMPLPAGIYTAVIKEAVAAMSNKQSMYAKVSMFVSPDQYPSDYEAEGNPEGTTLFYNLVPLEDTKDARFKVRKFCEAIGAPLSKDLDLTSWAGLTCKIEVKNSVYNDLQQANIVKVMPE